MARPGLIARVVFACGLVSGLVFGSSLPTAAQEEGEVSGTPLTAIEVSGQASTVLATYRQVMAGMDAFDRGIALAPDAKLSFQVLVAKQGTSGKGVRLELLGEHMRMSLPFAGKGRWTIPRDAAALADEANVVVNRKKDALKMQAEVQSPGLDEDTLRLGDLRLACKVTQAIRLAGMSFIERTLKRALVHGCDAMTLTASLNTRSRFLGYSLRNGERVSESDTVNTVDNTVRIPLQDLGWPDDTLVLLRIGPGEPAQ